MAAVRTISSAFNMVNVVSTVLLLGGGIGLSKLLAAPRFGVALVLVALLFTLPLAGTMIVKPRFGLFLLFVVSMVIIEIKRMAWTMEVGLVVEGLEGVLAIAVLASIVAKRDSYRFKSPLTFPVLVYIFFLILEAFHPNLPSTINIIYALRDPINFLVPFLAALYLIDDWKQLRFFLYFWLGTAVVIAAYGLWQSFVGLNNWERAWLSISPTHVIYGRLRIFSTLGSADALGMHMAISIVLALGVAFSTKNQLVKYACFGMVPLFVVADLYTLTRGAYSAVLVGVLTLAIITRNRSLFLGLVFAAVVAVLWYQVNESSLLANRIMTMFAPDQDESFTVRQNYIDDLLPVILSHPFGLGPATSGRQGWVLLEWSGLDPHLVESVAGIPTDNYYFRIAVETGWVGMGLFLLLLTVVLIYGLRCYATVKSTELRWLAASLVACYVAMAVASISNNYFAHTQLKLFFWFTMGVLAGLHRIDGVVAQPGKIKESIRWWQTAQTQSL